MSYFLHQAQCLKYIRGRLDQIQLTQYLKFIAILTCVLIIFGVANHKELSKSNDFYFVVEMESSSAGSSQVFFNLGDGYSEENATKLPVVGNVNNTYYFPVNVQGLIESIRFDPIDTTSTLKIEFPRIEDGMGKVLREFPLNSFSPTGQIRDLAVLGNKLFIQTVDDANDPTMAIANSNINTMKTGWGSFLVQKKWTTVGYLLFSLILTFLLCLIAAKLNHIYHRYRLLRNIVMPIFMAMVMVGLLFTKDYLLASEHYLVIQMESKNSGYLQVYFDTGLGFNEQQSKVFSVSSGAKSEYRVAISPHGNIQSIRIDPINTEFLVILDDIYIENGLDERIENISHDDLVPINQISSLELTSGRLFVQPVAKANDPSLGAYDLSISNNLDITEIVSSRAWTYLGWFLVIALGWILLDYLVERYLEIIRSILTKLKERPLLLITIAGSAATILSCYPVIFLGKTFSYALGAGALYSSAPWFPDMAMNPTYEDFSSSDVGATSWVFFPKVLMQYTSLINDFEFPFFDRSSAGGIPLYGQGQSLIGDLLHLIPVSMGGSALGWDLKVVISKAIFSIGMGALVHRLTNTLVPAIMIAISSAFLGFYAYRFNHVALFTLTYAPWIVLQWDNVGKQLLQDKVSYRTNLMLVLILLLLTWLQLNAGAVKEGVICAVFMHALGVGVFLNRVTPRLTMLQVLLFISGMGVSLILVTAPYWLIFLDTLAKSYTSYDVPSISTFSILTLMGFFENGFYQVYLESLGGPSTNLFILLSFSSALVGLFYRRHRPLFIALILFLAAFAFAYGLVPHSFILAMPLLKNIYHIGNTFSVPMMILSLVIAGYGIQHFVLATGKVKYLTGIFSLLLCVVLVAMFPIGALAKYTLIFILVTAVLVLLLLMGKGFNLSRVRYAPLLFVLVFVSLHIRHGLHEFTGAVKVDSFMTNPTIRPDFSAGSSAIDFLKDYIESSGRPARVVGDGFILFPGIQTRYGLEGVIDPSALKSPRFENLLDEIGITSYNNWVWLRLFESKNLLAQSRALDFLGVGFILANPGAQMPSNMTLIHSSDLAVWERKSVWPRAYFVNRVTNIDSVNELSTLLKDVGDSPFAAVEKQFIPQHFSDSNSPYSVVPAESYRLTNNSTSFSVSANGPGMVVLGENYYPGDFIATVNDKTVDYIPVNGASKGVWVDKAGDYKFKFTYRPERLGQSMALALLGLGIILILLRFTINRGSESVKTKFTNIR